MTTLTLSQNTINLINIAVADGPGTNNINYANAYNAIYSDIVANGNVNPDVQYWFSQAAGINTEQYTSTPTAAATYIWNYTEAAAASEGATITNAEMQQASNAIAKTVFAALQSNQYVLNDQENFSIANIVDYDAGTAVRTLQTFAPAGVTLDYAVWGGTLFARTALGDTAYFTDAGIPLQPDTPDSRAIISGLLAGSAATLSAGYSIALSGAASINYLDGPAINAILSAGEETIVGVTAVASAVAAPLAAIGAGVNYLYNAVTGTLVTLANSNQSAAGTLSVYEQNNGALLTFDQGNSGAGTVKLSDGAVINTGGTEDLSLANIAVGTGTAEQSLLTFFGQIDDPLTAAQLETDNFNSLNPTGTAYAVTGTVDQTSNSAAEVFYSPDSGPGAVVAGQSTATITDYDSNGNPYQTQGQAYNILVASGDISQDTITDIQELLAYNSAPAVTLTQAQLSLFSVIDVPLIYAATGGTYNLSGSSDTFNALFATDLIGTTLIGNDQNGQGLIASEFGTDTLQAGNGVGDILTEGGGVDTLVGGTGGDTFVAFSGAIGDNGEYNGLAAGSVVEGAGSGNTLLVSGDISGATVTGVQTLEIYGDVILNATELDGFSNVINNGTITAATGGTYSIQGISSADVNLSAGTDAGTTLIGNDANDEILTSSDFGNDTLTAGNGSGDTLDASGSFGNNTLTAGNGNNDVLDASDSSGQNTLIAGSGEGDVMYGGFGSTTFVAGAGNDTMIVDGGNNTFNFANAVSASNYTIDDYHTDNGQNVLQFASNVLPSSVTASQSGNDLVLAFGTDPITIQNYFLGADYQPTSIQFANGTVWNAQTIASLVSGTPSVSLAQATINNAPVVNNIPTVNFGNVREGSTVSEALSITNSALPVAELLDGSIGLVSGDATGSGSFSLLGDSSTDATDIHVGLGTGTAGVQSGSVLLNFKSDGTGVDTNGVHNLADQTVDVTGTVYREATASVAALPTNVIVHVGSTLNETLAITNGAANDGYSENLIASVAGTTSGITATGSTGDIAAQASSNAITVGISTAQAGVISGDVTLALASDGTGVDGFSATSIGQQTVAVNATVDNYAKASMEKVSGAGTLTQNGNAYALTLNLAAGGGSSVFDLGVLNNVTGPSDLLSGNFVTSSSSAFTLSGFSAFSGLAAGQSDVAPTVTFNATTAGTYVETITLNSTGSNASGYSGALAPETLTITVNVAAPPPPPAGQTYTLTTKAVTINGNAGNNTIIATNGTLVAGDKINGGTGGTNTLELQGAGTFNLATPATLTGISVITAQEGQAAYQSGLTTIAGTNQTVYLRSGLNATVNVLSDTSINAKNLNAAGITIYGANNSDIINLGTGNDTVYLGSNAETVNGGSGTDTFYETSSTIGATIKGISGKNTLDITGGGIVTMGGNITGINTVNLEALCAQPNYVFTANNTANLVINGTSNADTITVGAASQTVNGEGGNDRIIASAANAGVLVNGGTGINTLEITGGGTAVMNAKDANINIVQLDAATNLTLNSESSLTVNGSTGNDTFIAGTGNNVTLNGGGGNDTYEFGANAENTTINNAVTGGKTANGTIEFLSGVTDEKLWFQRSGNNLEIDLLGTRDQITVAGWFGTNASAQVGSITAGGLTLLDSQVAQLVTAMATYSSANKAFNPLTATTMPTNAALQSVIAASWHH
ncbi:MAG: choice-of-anchor D domain-containing protein [Alphaproteobacteria bacterium]